MKKIALVHVGHQSADGHIDAVNTLYPDGVTPVDVVQYLRKLRGTIKKTSLKTYAAKFKRSLRLA